MTIGIGTFEHTKHFAVAEVKMPKVFWEGITETEMECGGGGGDNGGADFFRSARQKFCRAAENVFSGLNSGG